MKRLILVLTVFTLVFSSCSSDDDSNSSVENYSIIGEWTITQRIVNGVEEAIGECEPTSIYRYSADGSYYEKHYAAVLGSSCLENPFFEVNGDWSKEDNETYIVATAQGTSSFKINFITENTHKLEDEILNDEGTVIATIIEYYTRN